MKSGKLWKLAAVCSFGLLAGLPGSYRPAEAVVCPGSVSCTTPTNCASFCIAQVGNPTAACVNKCCICRA